MPGQLVLGSDTNARMRGAGTAATRLGSRVLGQALLYHHLAPARAGHRSGQLGVLLTVVNRSSLAPCQPFCQPLPCPCDSSSVPSRAGMSRSTSSAQGSPLRKQAVHPQLCTAWGWLPASSPPTIALCCWGEGRLLAGGKGLPDPRTREAGSLLPLVSLSLCTRSWPCRSRGSSCLLWRAEQALVTAAR